MAKDTRRTRREEEDRVIAEDESRSRGGDSYGQGAPTDRLQFGYSPASATEAVAYHSMTPAAQWRTERATNYRMAILKSQRLPARHFETVESFFKLKKHWHTIAQQNQRGRSLVGSAAGGAGGEEAEDFLKQLALQNLGGLGVPPMDEDDAPSPSSKRNRGE